jgi:formylglycine-generating enzyme required for sulfatase activity
MLSAMTSLRVIDSGRRSFPMGRHPSKSVLLSIITLACLMAAGAQAQGLDAAPVRPNGFLDDFAAAQKKAAAFKRPLFVLFTGSDWCPLCIRLHREISDTQVFKKFAADYLVLFEADFPKDKKQTAAVKKQNEKLANTYGVNFFPTVLLLDATGKVLGQTGYQEGGADAYVKHLKDLLEKAGVKMTNAAETARSGPPTARPPAEAPRERVLNLGNTVTLKLALIPKGTFLMGSPATEKDPEHGHADNEVQHTVTISKSFYMGVTEVTQKQYETVMGKNPSTFKGPNNPVYPVTWDEAVEFCRKLSATTGKTIRLPTEAEWEYACRAGSKARFSFGDADTDLGAYAWYTANSADRTTRVKSTHPAGLKKPNAWGLYDMHGNVWEWCSDWYAADYGTGSQTDPAGPAKGGIRVLRGGSWNYCSWGCRLAGRGRIGPDGKYDVNGGGFRVVVAAEKD